MANLHEKKVHLKELKAKRHDLDVEIHELEDQIAELAAHADDQRMKNMGFIDEGDYRHYRTYVQRGVINWKGQYLHPAKVNVANFVRAHHDWIESQPTLHRNTYIELFHKRWRDGESFTSTGQPTLSHRYQLNDDDKDYQRFLGLGFGPITSKEMAYIKSDAEHEQELLTDLNHG